MESASLPDRRNFSQQQSMNGKSASDVFLFEAGGRKMILLARDDKYVGGSDHPFDLVKVIRVISGNVK